MRRAGADAARNADKKGNSPPNCPDLRRLPLMERRSARTTIFHPKVGGSGGAADQPEVFGVPVPGPLVHRALVDDVVADRPRRDAADLERPRVERRRPLE